jgi:hypothetical protein
MAGSLVVSTLNNDTGVFATQNGMTGIAKAWVNFNGTGTVAIRDSFNVSSITDNGTGDYTVNFTTAMPNANYSVNATNSPNFAGAFSGGVALFSNGTPTETAPTTTAARMTFVNTGGSAYDPKYVCVSVFSS